MKASLYASFIILFVQLCCGHKRELAKPSDYMLVSVKAVNGPNGRNNNNQNGQQSFYEDGIIVQYKGTGFIDDKYKNSQDYGVQSVNTRPVHRQSRSSSELYNLAAASLAVTKRTPSPTKHNNRHNSYVMPLTERSVNYGKRKSKPSRDQLMSDSRYILIVD